MSFFPAASAHVKATRTVSFGAAGKTFTARECSCYEAAPGRFVVQITTRHKKAAAECDFYDVRPVPCDFGRAAFRFVKAEAKAERACYNVLLDGDRSTCDCPHGTYKAHERGPCRHVLAAQALVERGQLPAGKGRAAVPEAAPATVAAVSGNEVADRLAAEWVEDEAAEWALD